MSKARQADKKRPSTDHKGTDTKESRALAVERKPESKTSPYTCSNGTVLKGAVIVSTLLPRKEGHTK